MKILKTFIDSYLSNTMVQITDNMNEEDREHLLEF